MNIENVCWVVGIIDSYGNVRSVIKTFDDPGCSDTHQSIFGLHGRRWRADNDGDLRNTLNLREFTEEELVLIKDHLEKILGNNCWWIHD